MAANGSAVEFQMVFGAAGYFVLGVSIGLANVWVLASILKYRALRDCKELLILMGLAAADSLNLFGYACCGAYRLFVIATGSQNRQRFTLDCITQPHTIIWSIGTPVSSVMLVAVSIDRFLLVALRHKYVFGLSRRYAWTTLGVVFGFCTSFALVAIISAAIWGHHDEATLHAFCYAALSLDSSARISPFFQEWYRTSSAVFPLLSIGIYLLIGPFYKWNSVGVSESLSESQQMERQRKLTRSMAISCFCTLVLLIVPAQLGWWFFDKGIDLAARFFFLLVLTNPLANVLIYHRGHKDMRKAMHALLKWKDLPENVDLWNTE